jgi:hypothetical protein
MPRASDTLFSGGSRDTCVRGPSDSVRSKPIDARAEGAAGGSAQRRLERSGDTEVGSKRRRRRRGHGRPMSRSGAEAPREPEAHTHRIPATETGVGKP